MELANTTRPTAVAWVARTRTNAGLMGSFGSTMIRVTSHADFTISFTSHGQYRSAMPAKCTGWPSGSTTSSRRPKATTATAEAAPAASRNGVK